MGAVLGAAEEGAGADSGDDDEEDDDDDDDGSDGEASVDSSDFDDLGGRDKLRRAEFTLLRLD